MKQIKHESGRSMVEMLGVLAIIGVLSIGGIMGYSYGMDKYRANEATNQIMLRAIDLMTQASNNNAELSLSSWENKQIQYDFTNEGYTEDGLIAFDMGTNTPLPKSVCEMVYDAMSSMAVQIDINKVRAESNDACMEENEMTFYFEGGISVTCDPACPEGQYCDNGICFKGGVPEMTRVLNVCSGFSDDCGDPCYGCGFDGSGKGYICTARHGASCTIEGEEGVCHWGECYPRGCTTNDDCNEPGTYCASTDGGILERFPSGKTGSCVPVNFVKREFGGETYYISNTSISWWDAEYACEVIGKPMIDVTDLVEKSSWDDSSDWDSDIVYTPFGQELKTLLGYDKSIWTQSLASDKKYVFEVSTSGYVISYSGFRNGSGMAVCRQVFGVYIKRCTFIFDKDKGEGLTLSFFALLFVLMNRVFCNFTR